MVKALIIILLGGIVFGAGAFYTYDLYIKPASALKAEKARGPEPPPPDPSLGDFAACLAVKDKGDPLATREALLQFLEHFPKSTRADEARDLLGGINARIIFSTAPAPEKQLYFVAKGDIVNRVAMHTHSTPEIIYRANNLTGAFLRVGQKLVIPPADFSARISLREKKLTLFNGRRFFRQYAILAVPAADTTKGPVAKRTGKVMSKSATDTKGNRVSFQDPGYSVATHTVSISIPGHSFYAASKSDTAARTGLGFAPEDLAEIAVLLDRNDSITIE